MDGGIPSRWKKQKPMQILINAIDNPKVDVFDAYAFT